MIARTLRCRKCGNEPAPQAFIDALTAWWPAIRVATHVCPKCGEKDEVRLGAGTVVFGYTYAAGALHFSEEECAEIPGLDASVDDETLRIAFGGKVREMPPSS